MRREFFQDSNRSGNKRGIVATWSLHKNEVSSFSRIDIEIVSMEIQKKATSVEFYSKEKLKNENKKDIVKDRNVISIFSSFLNKHYSQFVPKQWKLF